MLYGANNQVVTSSYYFQDMEVILPVDGEYILAIRGYAGLSAVVNYSFSIITPELKTFDLPLNQVVSGSIPEKGEQDTYTFAGTAGQQIFFDALGGDYLPFTLYDPAGSQIARFDNRSDRSPQDGFIFSMNGTYKIVIDGDGEALGNYKFRLLDRAAAIEVSLDTDITGTFDNGGLGSTGYRFTLSDTRYLFFDGQGGDGNWLLYGANGQYITQQHMTRNSEFWLGAGDYFLVAQGYLNYWWGNSGVNYTLRIVTPELNTTPMTVGDTISGNITEKGEQDYYTFAGTAGQQLFFDSLSGDYLQVKVLDPTGRQIFNSDSHYDRGPENGLTFSMDGTYRLIIDGDDEYTGNYKFRLLDKAAAVEIPLDTDITGTFDNGGLGSAGYRFTLSDTRYLFFDGQGGDGNWILYNSNGQTITQQHMTRNSEFWLGAGDYFLVAQGYLNYWWGNSGVNYTFRIVTPELNSAPMTIGDIISGTISEKGEQDYYTFAGTAGQQLFFDSLGGDYLQVKVLDPTGREIFNTDSRYDRGPDNALTFSMNGTYRLIVDGDDEATGNYKFRLLDRAAAAEIFLDTDIIGIFDNGGLGSTGYRFTLNESHNLFIDGQGGNGAWTVYGANGKYITARDMNYDQPVALDAGAYFLVAQGYGGGEINYKFRISDQGVRVSSPVVGTSITLGSVVSGSIIESGEQDTYVFDGTVGQQLFFDSLGGDYYLQAVIYDPTGREISNASTRSDRGPNDGLTLSMSGAYRLVVSGVYQYWTGIYYTGNYKFQFLDKAAATEIPLDTDIAGTFDNEGFGSKGYRFTLNESRYLCFDGQGGQGQWNLYNTNGQYITSQSMAYDNEFWISPGDYFLVANGYGYGNSNYSFRIVTPELNVTSMTVGSIISGSITEKAEHDTYVFDGTAGQQLFLDSLGADYLNFRLHDPAGREILNTDTRYDRGPNDGLTLSMSGAYRVVVRGAYNYWSGESSTGNYKFRLLDKADAIEVPLDTDITGTFDNGGLGSAAYRFTLNDSKYLFFDGQGGSGNWLLYNSNGQYITAQGTSSNSEFWLGAGDYFLIAQGYGYGNSNYNFRIVTPELNVTPLTVGETISGAIAEKGEQDTYTFNGMAGQQLFFDNLASGYGSTYILLDPAGREIYRTQYWDSPSDRGPDRGWTLSMSGVYRLIIDGNDENTENYKFRLLDRADAIEVPLDTNITGTFDNGGLGSVGYRFTLNDSKYLFFDGQEGNGQLNLYNTNGQFIISQGTTSNREFWLGAGDYFLVAVGYGNGSNYNFRIVTPELNTTPLTVGDTISGSISEKGEQDTYTFNGTAGQQLFFDNLDSGYGSNYILLDPTGREIYRTSRWDSYQDRGPDRGWTLSMSGAYRLIIDRDDEETGNYKFRLIDKAAATALTFDQDFTGVFEFGGLESKAYRFSGSQGQYFYLDTSGSNSYQNRWLLYGPGGQQINSGYIQDGYYDDYEFALPSSGEYLLIMQGNGNENRNFKLHLAKPELTEASLTLGSTVSGTLTKSGERDTYTFTGSIGQQLFFDALQGTSSLKARLYAPSGVTVLDKDSAQDWGAFNLDEEGIYRLVIDGDLTATGDYRFTLSDRTQSDSISFGTQISGALSAGNAVALYRFNGRTGQTLNFDLTASSWNSADWVLYDPSGRAIGTPTSNSPDFKATLGVNGSYTLSIVGKGNADSAVDYSFNINDVSARAIQNIGLGVLQSGTLNAGQTIDYSFTATAGSLIQYDGQMDNWQMRASLLNPDGTAVFNAQDARSDSSPILLSQSGNYKLQIFGYYPSTSGAYQFNLLELPRSFRSPNLNYLEFESAVSGTLNGYGAKVYTFQGAPGQQIRLNAISGQSMRATLYDASANVILTQNGLNWYQDAAPVTLNQNGFYYLVLNNEQGSSEAYRFQMLDMTTAEDITFGVAKQGSVDNSQLSKLFKLNANAGDRLYFDNISSTTPGGDYWNYSWKLFGPGNNVLLNNYQNNDSEVIIPTTGEYYLELQGGYSTAATNYNFRVVRPERPAGDIVTPGSGESSAHDSDSLGLFPVKIEVKDTDGATAIQAFNIRLWPDPDNGSPVILSTPETRFSLADKTYRYQLRSVDPDGDDLVYRLLDAPLGATLNSETGELLWFPESAVAPGTKANFKIEVNDRKGGTDIQTYTVDVFGNLGKIHGAVFDDLNTNGIRDTKLKG